MPWPVCPRGGVGGSSRGTTHLPPCWRGCGRQLLSHPTLSSRLAGSSHLGAVRAAGREIWSYDRALRREVDSGCPGTPVGKRLAGIVPGQGRSLLVEARAPRRIVGARKASAPGTNTG